MSRRRGLDSEVQPTEAAPDEQSQGDAKRVATVGRDAASANDPSPATDHCSTPSRSLRLKRVKVLVTGGAGFIGSRVAQALLAAGHDVILTGHLFAGPHNAPTAYRKANS